jgi:hypothetical protein
MIQTTFSRLEGDLRGETVCVWVGERDLRREG